MNYYVQNVLCYSCRGVCKLHTFHFRGDGSVKLIGWCGNCQKDATFITELDTLVTWAKHHDNPFPTEADKVFLHNNRICWDSPPKLLS